MVFYWRLVVKDYEINLIELEVLFVISVVRVTRSLEPFYVIDGKFEISTFLKILQFLDNFSNRWRMPVASSWSK